MNKRGVILTIFLGILFLSQGVLALEGTRIIVNSEDWEDVYSTMLYSTLSGRPSDFLTSTSHGPILLAGIPKTESLGIVTSEEVPFSFGYAQTARAAGYPGVEEIIVESANLHLVREPEMDEIENFIIVGNSYGFSAVAVAPYALQTKSWVFLADRVNIAEIEAILDSREVNQILIYGYVEREVNDALQRFNPKIINSGDRFADNVEIVKEFKKIKNVQQVVLTNGEFIEKEIMNGIHPVLFTGRDNVPQQIGKYLKDSDVSVGVLIGNELINAATNIRRTTGISVMVKFAQGARRQTTGVSAVEGLDLFYLPAPTVNLGIYSARYNRAKNQVEITYHSTSNVPIFFQGTVTVISDTQTLRAGDLEPIFIAPNDYKTISYPNMVFSEENLRAELVTFFGEVSTSLDYRLDASIDLGIVNIIDNCEVEATYLKYNIQREAFIIGVKNLGDVDCFVDIELEEMTINNIRQTIGSDGSQEVLAGKKGKIEISQRMTKEDLDDNPFVDLIAYFGEREETLVNIYRKKFELDIDRYTLTTYLIISVSIILLLLILFWWKLRRDEEKW